MIKYTTLLHEPRIKHKLTLNEYVLCDSIYKLQTNPKSTVPNWCYAKREYLAEFLGVTKQTILNLIESCIKKGLIIKNEDTKFLQVLQVWYDDFVCFTESKDSLPMVKEIDSFSKDSLPVESKDSLPPTYNKGNSFNNNINITPPNGETSFSFTLKSKKLFTSLSDEYKDKLQEKIENSGCGMPWKSFRNTCIANGYKYADFWLAYQNWAKRDYNKPKSTMSDRNAINSTDYGEAGEREF